MESLFIILIILCYIPALALFSQYLWHWSLVDIRDTEWKDRTWIYKTGTHIDTFITLLFWIPVCIFSGTLLVVAGCVVIWYFVWYAIPYIIKLLVSDLLSWPGITIASLLFVLLIFPLIVRILRRRSRKHEKLMRDLGQHKPLQ